MEKQGKKKIIIIAVAAILIVLATVVSVLILRNKKEEYRILKVYEIEGEALVKRENIGDIDAYNDMVLESGDTVVVKSGLLTLKLDDDKYVYAESDTEFELVATGSGSNSKTTIELKAGAITNEIQSPLSDTSSYEVNTPNSNMAVRGTIYRVYTYYEEGIRYTKVSVFDGKVDSSLRQDDGTLSDKKNLENGKEVLIFDDDEKADYVGDISDIDYDALPEHVIELLGRIAESGRDIGISADELKNYMKSEKPGPFTVTFMYNGNVFGTQVVNKGDKAARPTLSPAQSGNWDYDFNEEVTGDITIEWR